MTASSVISSLGFVPDLDLACLRPAPYNPRSIDDEAIARLRQSVRLLGVVRPVIALSNGTIVAGHQRTKACTAEGITRVPAFILSGVAEADEVRFNQLHNGTDTEMGVVVSVPAAEPGWRDVPAADIQGEALQAGAPIRHEIFRLVSRYGLWGGAVARPDGTIVSGGQYALSMKIASLPCRVCYLSPTQAEHAEYLTGSYGEFNYRALPWTPWQQTFCQPQRHEGSRLENSPLYEGHILPQLKRTERLIDIGCGMGAYVRRLRAGGFRAWGWEPYWRKGDTLDRGTVRTMTEEVIAALAEGPFAVGVADTVINATGSADASRRVLLSLSALVRRGGRVHVSGIERETFFGTDKAETYACKGGRQRRVHFPDKQGTTAIWHHGAWFFQWANRIEEARELLTATVGTVERLEHSAGYWRATVRNERPVPDAELLKELALEFDPPYPDGKSLGMADRIVASVLRNITA